MEDAKIVELFWERKECAIQAASDKYNSFCFRNAYKILYSREDSEECVNDTWFAAWRYIPPKKPSVLSTFLRRITRGFAIDCLRKKSAAKRIDQHMIPITEEVESLNQAMACAMEKEDDLTELFNDFLRSLKPKDRDIFVRRYWYMDSLKEISERHRITESSVKSNLYRSRNKLRKILMKERRVL